MGWGLWNLSCNQVRGLLVKGRWAGGAFGETALDDLEIDSETSLLFDSVWLSNDVSTNHSSAENLNLLLLVPHHTTLNPTSAP